MRTLGILRWTAGALVFAAAAFWYGQTAGETRVAPASARLGERLSAARHAAEAPKYSPIPVTDRGVETALQVALADQQRRNRNSVKLMSVLSAERQAASGENIRLCLGIDRQGRADSARVITHRSEKNQWSVTLWAWGACR